MRGSNCTSENAGIAIRVPAIPARGQRHAGRDEERGDMSSIPRNRGLASPLFKHAATLTGGRMLERDLTATSSDGYGRRATERRRGAAALMAAVSAGISIGSEPRAARERLEEE